jgi:hypothetical protein
LTVVGLQKRRLRRTGNTLVEAALAITLAAAFIVLVMEAFRFFSTRSGNTMRQAEQAREAGLFMERLRRTLRFAVRVIPTESGFRVLHQARQGGGLRLVATRVEVVGAGQVVIFREDGSQRRVYDVGGLEDPTGSSLQRTANLEVDLELDPPIAELIRVLLEGGDGDLVLIARVRSLLEREGVFVAEEERSLEELEAELLGREVASERLDLSELEGGGRVEASGFEDPGVAEEAEVPPGAGPIRDGLDDEADLLAAETRPVGLALLPSLERLPAGLPALADEAALQDALEAAGIRPELAVWLGPLLTTWDEALRAGDRRRAGRAVAVMDSLLRREGLSSDEVIQVLSEAAAPAATLVEAAAELPETPGGVEAAAASGEGDELRIPESLVETETPPFPPEPGRVPPEELVGVGPDDPGRDQGVIDDNLAGKLEPKPGDPPQDPPVDPPQDPRGAPGEDPAGDEGPGPETAEEAVERTQAALKTLVAALEVAQRAARARSDAWNDMNQSELALEGLGGGDGDAAAQLAAIDQQLAEIDEQMDAALADHHQSTRAQQQLLERMLASGAVESLAEWRQRREATSNSELVHLRRKQEGLRRQRAALEGSGGSGGDALARLQAERRRKREIYLELNEKANEAYRDVVPLVASGASLAAAWDAFAEGEDSRARTARSELERLQGGVVELDAKTGKNVVQVSEQLAAARTIAAAVERSRR